MTESDSEKPEAVEKDIAYFEALTAGMTEQQYREWLFGLIFAEPVKTP
jgi:hypothetical protein